MTIIYAATEGQHLIATVLPKLAEDNVNTVRLSVVFDSSWNSYPARTAVFTTSKSVRPYPVAMSAAGDCLIPPEVLAEEGKLFIVVKGVNSTTGATKSSTRLTVKVLGGHPAVIISDPAPGVYQQLLTANAILNSRMSELEAAGTVEGSEVIGIRTGADGTVYDTAGDAVRGQIKPIASQVKAKNLIDFKRLTRGYFTESGAFSQEVAGYQEVTSDFIEIDPSSTYYFAHRFNTISAAIKSSHWVENWFGLNLYDAGKTFIKRVTYDTLGCVIPGETFEGAAYVRVSYRTYMFNRPIFAVCSVPCDPMDEIRETDNLLDTFPMIFNGYVSSTNGLIAGVTIDENGYVPAEQDERTSDFIPCESGKEMLLFATAVSDNFMRIAFYDANGTFVSSVAYHPTSTDDKGASDYDNIFDTFTVPADAVALRVSCRGAYIKECVLAYNDDRRKALYAECERKHASKYETERVARLSVTSWVRGVAHRGSSADAPENTLAAYRLAKQKGFSFVECDVSFTSDGVPVLLHDSTVDRTSNGSGSINALTLEAVRALDFGSWKSEDYAGERIPTFEEFIALCRSLGLHPYIEIKPGSYTKDDIAKLVNIVRAHGMLRKVSWISFNYTFLTYVRELDRKARLGFVVDTVTQGVVSNATALQNSTNEVFIDASAGALTAAAVELCAAADIPVEVWTVNSETTIQALNPYVSGVTSDSLIAGAVLYAASID